MKSLPENLLAQHARFIEALCEDWREAGRITRDTPRANAVLEIAKQSTTRDGSEPNKPLPTDQ